MFSVNILMKALSADNPINLQTVIKYTKLPQCSQKGNVLAFLLCPDHSAVTLRLFGLLGERLCSFTKMPLGGALRSCGRRAWAAVLILHANRQRTDGEGRRQVLGVRPKLRTRNLRKLNSWFLNTLYGKNTAKIFFCSKRKKYTAMVTVLRMN